jgi:hypothetical protein
MNSDRTKAMDMPPCDVLAAAIGGFGDRFQIDDESGPGGRLGPGTRVNCLKAHDTVANLYANFSGCCLEIEHRLRWTVAPGADKTEIAAAGKRCKTVDVAESCKDYERAKK